MIAGRAGFPFSRRQHHHQQQQQHQQHQQQHIEARDGWFVRVCRLRSSNVFVCVYIGIQLFSAKMMLAGAPPGWAFWGGVRVGDRVYIGIHLLSAKSCRRGRRREVEFGAASKIWRKVTEILYKTCEDRTRQTRTNFTSRTSMCWCWCWWCWCCCCCRRQKGKPASYAGCELCGCEPALPAFSTDAHPLQCVCAVSWFKNFQIWCEGFLRFLKIFIVFS